jgi:lipopolysaccharide export system permease protein
MVFERALRRELTQSAVGVFVALFAIMVTTQLIRLLNEAAGGKVAPEAVAALLGFSALNYLPTLLSLTLFVSILLTLSRSYRDSEMVVWFSSGLSLIGWVRPILRFTLPVVAAIALLSLLLSPWALSQSAEFRQKMNNRGDASQVSPGAFQEGTSSDRVVFVEAVGKESGVVRNVFVNSFQHGRFGVMVAATGRQEVVANGDRFMVLDAGRRYEVAPGTTEFRIMEFDRYSIRVEARELRGVEKTPRNATTWELMQVEHIENHAELLWRVGVPISALVLSLLAIPLAFVNPRAGRSANLVFALLAFMIYSNLISVSQAWVAQGRISFSIGWWAVHFFVIAILPLLFARRILVFSIWRPWR